MSRYNDKFAASVYEKGIIEVLLKYKFTSSSRSTLSTLIDVVRAFVQNIGHSSVRFSQLSGRTVQNIFDVKNSLSENFIHIREIHALQRTLKDAPQERFLMDIPSFPIVPKVDLLRDSRGKKRKMVPKKNKGKLPNSKLLFGEGAKDEVDEFPFLPPFPPEYTYKFTMGNINREKMVKNEEKEVTAALSQIELHRRELEKANSRRQVFSRDLWGRSDVTAYTKPEKEGIGTLLQENEDSVVNPYFVIATRKQSMFRDTLLDQDEMTEPTRREIDPTTIEVSTGTRKQKRKRIPVLDEDEMLQEQRKKRFKGMGEDHFDPRSHKILAEDVE